MSRSGYAEKRQAERYRVRLWAQLRHGMEFEGDVVVRDLSAEGFRFESSGQIALGAKVKLSVGDQAPVEATVVRVSDRSCGCEFAEPLSESVLNALVGEGPFARHRPARIAQSEMPEPVVEKWPRWVRLAMLAGGTALGWFLIIETAQFLIR